MKKMLLKAEKLLPAFLTAIYTNKLQIPGLLSIMMEKPERDQVYFVLTISKFKTFASLICSAKLSLLKLIYHHFKHLFD